MTPESLLITAGPASNTDDRPGSNQPTWQVLARLDSGRSLATSTSVIIGGTLRRPTSVNGSANAASGTTGNTPDARFRRSSRPAPDPHRNSPSTAAGHAASAPHPTSPNTPQKGPHQSSRDDHENAGPPRGEKHRVPRAGCLQTSTIARSMCALGPGWAPAPIGSSSGAAVSRHCGVARHNLRHRFLARSARTRDRGCGHRGGEVQFAYTVGPADDPVAAR
jgi:hypothetical protein